MKRVVVVPIDAASGYDTRLDISLFNLAHVSLSAAFIVGVAPCALRTSLRLPCNRPFPLSLRAPHRTQD